MPSFAPSPFSAFSEAFQAHVDAALEARSMEREIFRPAIGAGRLGNECDRALGYEFHRVAKDPDRNPKGPLLRIFERGHAAEEGMVQFLFQAGFEILTKAASGKQFRFDLAVYEDTGKGRIKGMADGVIIKGPAEIGGVSMAYPCLWENKEVGTKKYNKFVKQGVKRADAQYYTQVNLLMQYLGLQAAPTLFTAKCADTQAIYAELVQFDVEAAQKGSDRGVRVVRSESPEELPRIAVERTDFRCKWCDYQDRCWAAPAVATGPVTAPAWFTNGKA